MALQLGNIEESPLGTLRCPQRLSGLSACQANTLMLWFILDMSIEKSGLRNDN
jgi:hypothetical protein